MVIERTNIVWVVKVGDSGGAAAEQFLVEGSQFGPLAQAERFGNEIDADTVISILDHPDTASAAAAYVANDDSLHLVSTTAAFLIIDLNNWGWTVDFTWTINEPDLVTAEAREPDGPVHDAGVKGTIDVVIAALHQRLDPKSH